MANEEKLSPMMVQYLETKKEYPDCLLFYRIGDFYEMFFDDAKIGSEVLDLVLTGKECGLSERAPMCGVPFHAADNYINRLIKQGYKVAICEQVEDPKTAKGLVKREVIRIVTPGTVTESATLIDEKNNYLVSLSYLYDSFGLAALDISTGDFLVTEIKDIRDLYDELNRFSPSEIICDPAFMISGADIELINSEYDIHISEKPGSYYDYSSAVRLIEDHFHTNVFGLGLNDIPAGLTAAGASLRYIYDTQFSKAEYLTEIKIYNVSEYMIIDSATMRNLELTETMRDKEKKGSLLHVLDKTKTAMGSRMLRSMVIQPLKKRDDIEKRLDAIEELNSRFIDREEISEYLKAVYDLERLLSRISSLRSNPLDLNAFRQSLSMMPAIKTVLDTFEASLIKSLMTDFDPLTDIYDLIDSSIDQEAPVSVRDGGIIKSGYNDEIDRLRNIRTDGKKWLLSLEAEEREKTGIRSLKIKYNKNFGYCFEVTNTFSENVPDYFIRKQTLANGERYTTDRLEELASDIINADDKLKAIEYDIFCDINNKIAEEAARIRKLSRAVAYIDSLCSLSCVAQRNNYTRPQLNNNGVISIKEGRHPVVELMLKDGLFVPNDTYLDKNKNLINIITGPNMAGKSTYMRQVALITLMAQIGSFVPAKSADISICDRIFTRVGASDDLAQGRSTFMVEMTEVANILRNATSESLLILDEIGRGTSTYDGLSIAWSVVEYISDKKKLGARTLFATHYHELTEIEGRLNGVHNYCIAVSENNGNLVFLRKIIPGGADKSYGIAVARLAGVPDEVTLRAEEIANDLSKADINSIKESGMDHSQTKASMSVNDTSSDNEVLKLLKDVQPDKLTPIEALLLINDIKSRL